MRGSEKYGGQNRGKAQRTFKRRPGGKKRINAYQHRSQHHLPQRAERSLRVAELNAKLKPTVVLAARLNAKKKPVVIEANATNATDVNATDGNATDANATEVEESEEDAKVTEEMKDEL